MYDNYSYVDMKIHEHKAPTDDSIRLCKEFEEKIKNSLIKSIQVVDNKFNFTCLIFYDDRTCDKILKYRFTLNSKEFVGNIVLPVGVSENSIKYEMYVYQELTKEISTQITECFMENIMKENYGKPCETFF